MFKRFKFDKHHRFEWFGVGVVALAIVMLFISISAFVVQMKQNNENKANRVIYTQKFGTSLSGLNGQVEKIYRSDDKTKVFLLLTFFEAIFSKSISVFIFSIFFMKFIE